MNEVFLEVLACPKSKRKLTKAPAELLEKLNAAIKKGNISSIGQEKRKTAIEAALVDETGKILYIIDDDIPCLIYDMAIDYSSL